MNKPKIHELAKELNVTSKRLMEKLNEIGIYPKSHMTALEDDELEKLFNHIGLVRRDKNDNGGQSRNDSDNKNELAETAVKKNVPRIIRKTEVIIHDDTPLEEARGKKERKPYVRVSDSNDGLIAGFTRGSKESPIAGIRKHTKPKESVKEVQEENKPVLKLEMDTPIEKPKKPVDDILSIKKVSHRQENKPEKAEISDESKDTREQDSMQKESIVMEKQTKTDSRDESAVKTLPEESSSDAKSKPALAEKEEKAEEKAKTAEVKKLDKEPEKKDEKEYAKKEEKKEEKRVPETPSQEIRQEARIQADAQKPVTESPRETVAPNPRREDNQPRDLGQRRADNQGKRQDGASQNAPSHRAEGRQDRRQSDQRPHGQAREGGRDNKDGDYQGNRQNDRPFGQRQSSDRGARQGDSRREDRGQARGNKGLVIPKVAAPSGTVEEKVFTRGERRTFQTVEKQKEEKKELKKDSVRPVTVEKSHHIRKKIDTVIGHKANVKDMMSDDFVIDEFYDDKEEAINAKRAEKKLKKNKQKEKYIPPKAVLTDITIGETITVKELAEALKKTAAEVIKRLFLMGIVATQNQVIDFDTAAIIGDEFGVNVHKEVVVSEEEILFDESEDAPEDLVPRAPVVVVMGHVDHGKTSLLDAIRSAHIAESEAGGITQHIGAYTVNLNGRDITFLDTPGHEAFTAMRARGAQVTDIAILVVAADDGVMPQTKEAINHAKAAGVSIIVAINKIDKPNADPERVKQELAQNGLLIEEWGGDVIAVPVSAKKHQNIDQLLEMVLLTADILELKANPKKQAKGTVIEARLDKNKGPIATLLVQRGTLRVGDAILSGSTFGHVRTMTNDKGKRIKEAGPSIPVEVAGLSEVPEAGEVFYVVTDEKLAKQLAEKRKQEDREKHIGRAKISLDDLFSQIQQGNVKDLNLIIKADVQGSVEAISQSMEKLSNDEVKVKVVHSGVGSVTESDVKLAEVSNAIIIGFNVRPSANVMELAKASGVDIRLYRIIYDAIEDMEKAMKGMLAPTYKEVVDGHAEIRQIFKVSSVGTIGGAYVTDGKIIRTSDVRVVRNGIVVYEGKLASLKRFKDDVREVAAGFECGLMVERFNDIKENDVIESFHMEEVERT